MRFALAAAAALCVVACGSERETAPAPSDGAAPEVSSIDQIAKDFVKLGLALGEHDPNYVDAYQGPAEWADAAKSEKRPLDELEAEARRLIAALEPLSNQRAFMLEKYLTAAVARIRLAKGETLSFDEETRLIYDAVAPSYDIAEFDAALAEVDALLPGDGPVQDRVEAFRNSLAIPADKMLDVFNAAIAECKRRTAEHMTLPESETFTLEFVTDKSWSGYNWYQGDFESLIQINTDLPIIIDRAVDLGCHEGYPGHHTLNTVIDRDLLKERGWVEYAISPLYSPTSIISEGSGNYGIELAFPGGEKIAFERDVLFPLAGLDSEKAATLEALNELRKKLSHADNHAAREYLDGRMSRDETIEFLMRYKLSSRERAEQRVRFIETYRGYVINYNLGEDLVGAYVEANAAAGEDPWAAFADLLSEPKTASQLVAK